MNFLKNLVGRGTSLKTLLLALGSIGWMEMTEKPDPANLPDDPTLLKAHLVDTLQKLDEAEQQIERLTRTIGILRRMTFGPKREFVPAEQLILAFAVAIPHPKPPPEPMATLPSQPKSRGSRVCLRTTPEVVVDLDLPEVEKPCPDCGVARTAFDFEDSRQLDCEPCKFFVRVFRRMKYVCKPCRAHVETAPLPVAAGPIERAMPGFGLLALVIISKYADHQPFYRQSKMYARQGIKISRSTMCDWMRHATQLLEPIVERIRQDVLASRILKTDDTVVRLIVPGRGSTVQGRMWGYLGDHHHNQIFYKFTPDRKQEHPLRELKDFKGVVHADAYKGYDPLFEDGTRVEQACWAHTRRYFFEAKDSDPERAALALGYIKGLYAIEAEARDLDAATRADLRRRRAGPLLVEFRKWLGQESLRVLPKSPMGEAMRYALRQWDALLRYVDDGEASIDTNAIERALRGIALGRKNFMFVASPEGGRWAAVAYSLIESCKLNGVEPYAYLKDVLRRVWTHPASDIDQLMPKNWKLGAVAVA